jgi:hypothetical protein
MLDKQNDYEFFIQGRKPCLISIKEDVVKKFIDFGNMTLIRIKYWNDKTECFIKEFFEKCVEFSRLQLPGVLQFQHTCNLLKDFVPLTKIQEQLQLIPEDPLKYKFEIANIVSQVVMIAKIVHMSILPQEISMKDTFDPDDKEFSGEWLNDQVMKEAYEFLQENKGVQYSKQSLLDPTMQNIDKDTGLLTPFYHSQELNDDQILNLLIQTIGNINTVSERRILYTLWRMLQWFMKNNLINTVNSIRYYKDHFEEFITLPKDAQIKLLNQAYDIIKKFIKDRDEAHEKLDF